MKKNILRSISGRTYLNNGRRCFGGIFRIADSFLSLASHRANIFFAIFVALYAAVALYWFIMHTAPPTWDDGLYLATSESLYHSLKEGDLTGFWNYYMNCVFGTKAPLIVLLPLPAYFLISHGMLGVAFTQIAIIVLFCWIAYRLFGELTSNRWTALVAVVIITTMPAVFGLATVFLVEYGLMTLVTLWMWVQLRSNNFRIVKYNLGMGVTLGLGLLMKSTFPAFIAGPAILGIVRYLRETGLSWRSLGTLFLSWSMIIVVGISLAGTWYFKNYQTVINFAIGVISGPGAKDYSFGDVWEVSTYLRFFKDYIYAGISTYYGALFLALLLLWLAKRVLGGGPNDKDTVHRQTGVATFLFMWFMLPFVLFSSSEVKDFRYTLPIFPAIGAGISILLFRVFSGNKLRGVGISLALLFPIILFLNFTFPILGNYQYWSIGGWHILGAPLGYAGKPRHESWPHLKIIRMIERDAPVSFPGSQPPFVLVAADMPYWNQHTFKYYLWHLNSKMIRTPWGWTALLTRNEDDWQRLYPAWVLQAKYLITKTGNQGPGWSTYKNTDIHRMLSSGELPYKAIVKYDLPDGSQGILWRSCP